MTDLLSAALSYAQQGIPVFPVHWPIKTGPVPACSCGQTCGRTAKHPLSEHGLLDATTATEQIREWWKQWPKANIGMPCGPKSGVWALDVDLPSGPQKLEILTLRRGELSPTLCIRTGSGGLQHLWRWTDGIRNSAGKVEEHLDVRGDGGYVLLPPSLHGSGGVYVWEW